MGQRGLGVVSALAENAAPHLRAVVEWVAGATGLPLAFDAETPWPHCEADLYAGRAALGFVCGLPYILEAHSVEALAAPVMAGERYGDRPVYFSDVVVRADSPFERFEDLRGASWAYNEPGSHSGYNLVRYHLASIGERRDFFGSVIGSGAHQRSLRMVVEGLVDASAIDTTVLEEELRAHPELASGFRVIGTLGPSPIQPLVGSRGLPRGVRRAVAAAVARMHEDRDGRAILQRAGMRRFDRVSDADYDEIRRMTRIASRVTLDHPPALLASPSCRGLRLAS